MRLYTSELVKKYKARTVVNHVSIDVNQGEIVGLLGPNGAGKTTTFYMIVGLIKPNEGQIFLEDDNGQVAELTKEPVYRRAQMGVGYLAQEASVFRRLSVEDNIKAVLEMTDLKKDEQAARCEALIEEFRLQKVRKSLGIQLSGGERRRTEIARAVAINPAFILLDEPFAGVDPIAVEDIQSIVATLKNKNIGVIITDHNVDETLAITDRTYLLFEGKILKAGSPRSWLPTRWCARSIWDSISNCGAVRRSTNSARDNPRAQPKRIRPRRNRPYPPSVGQCPADRPRGIRPTPAYDGTNPDRNPEPFSACGKRPSRQAREVRNEIRKGLRTRNRFRERIPEKTNRQPFSNTGLHRTVRANHSGFGKWKAKQRLFDKCRNGLNSELPHRKIQ